MAKRTNNISNNRINQIKKGESKVKDITIGIYDIDEAILKILHNKYQTEH